jgi:hypothetical protein
MQTILRIQMKLSERIGFSALAAVFIIMALPDLVTKVQAANVPGALAYGTIPCGAVLALCRLLQVGVAADPSGMVIRSFWRTTHLTRADVREFRVVSHNHRKDSFISLVRWAGEPIPVPLTRRWDVDSWYYRQKPIPFDSKSLSLLQEWLHHA